MRHLLVSTRMNNYEFGKLLCQRRFNTLLRDVATSISDAAIQYKIKILENIMIFVIYMDLSNFPTLPNFLQFIQD